MADASVFETGKLTDVWVQCGLDAFGQKRFQRANFDVLNWSSDGGYPAMYVVPLGIERTNSADQALNDLFRAGREFGYYGVESFVVDPSQGDGSDTIFGLHSFGYV